MLVMTGCNTQSIHQDDRYNPPVYWGSHVVKSGETLYSIAWRYGRDYRELGDANDIAPPYNLKAGQVIRLDKRGSVSSASAPSQPASPARPSPRPETSKPKVSRPAKTSGPTNKQHQTVANIEWRWPHVGTVIAGYSTSGKVNKGIDIAGKPGDSVYAAASGHVVYAGDGLLGYGNLVIVNHNEHYLSAYAHNRKILVKEGEDVAAGQTIAELGSSGTDRPKLHFEIRKNGNPVNPLPYLPSR
ncbi:peptidoglycan DD-metalloendopeptidase family protein [Marinobacter sp. CHS3-4]|uniref:peptidoglycan DD-metalloendopeptidase family protein n=1 Tax=Marinobacter sp. CHS3-4 TaxID=3045174 RepID=UPI0024B48773|nr:peptidoglycan DD-metalloendopeptidase family protein [Marinobacter sp. CHS3-4]MDI9246835.1 peptidoglycan DD-metalloendopeptidase family protein [Marinobacter sp. CHS3-4]